jgi:hypothetical protein
MKVGLGLILCPISQEKMRVLFYLIIISVGMCSAEESKDLPRFVPASNRTPDLDFTEEVPGPPPLNLEKGISNHQYPWFYWGLGLTAAAGGVTFLLWEKERPTKIQKSVQEFSDDRN